MQESYLLFLKLVKGGNSRPFWSFTYWFSCYNSFDLKLNAIGLSTTFHAGEIKPLSKRIKSLWNEENF
jgi:hypothetical protein